MIFGLLFCFLLFICLKGLELVLNEGESYYLDLDEAYQLDFSSYSVSPSDPSDFTINITSRLDNNTYKSSRNYLKVIERPHSTYYFVGLELQTLVLMFFNDMKIQELTQFDLSTALSEDDPLNCKSMVFLNFSLVVECYTTLEKQAEFLIFQINETNFINTTTNKSTTAYSFWNISHYEPLEFPSYMPCCSRSVFFSSETHLFWFCPFSQIRELREIVEDVPIHNNSLLIYNFDEEMSTFIELPRLKKMKFQDIILVYTNYFVILDYETGLLIYQFKDINVFVQISTISLPETNYLFVKSRTIDSVYPNKIKNFLYVASRTNILEILYTSPQSIVYSKLYQLNQKNETSFCTEDLLITPNYVVAIQRNHSLLQPIEILDAITVSVNNASKYIYVFKIFSNDLDRMSSIHHIEYISTNFLRGFVFNLYQEMWDNFLLSYQNDDGVIIYAVYKISDSKLVVTCCKSSLESKQNFTLNLTVSSNYNNKSVVFKSFIPLYLLPTNYTDITFRNGFQREYLFQDNYFEIPLNNIPLGSNIDYEFLGNGLYDGSPESNVGNIFLDYHSNLTIRDDKFAQCKMISGFMDFQSKAFILLMHDPVSTELFNVFCTNYDFGNLVVDECTRDKTLLLIKNITYCHIDKDIIFIYSKFDPFPFYICLGYEGRCGGAFSQNYTDYEEILFINNNLILARRTAINALGMDILAINYTYNNLSKNPYNVLDVIINKTQAYDDTNLSPNIQFLDASLIDLNILVVRTDTTITFFKITSTNYTTYKFVKSNEYQITNKCHIIMMKLGLLITICVDSNQIREYIIENPYNIAASREYPLFWYQLLSDPSPSTDQKYLYVSAVDTRTGGNVLLIYNPRAATCEILIKIALLSHTIKKFIPIDSTIDSYSIVYLLLDDVLYDEMYVVNTNPYLYGNFSYVAFQQLYNQIAPIQFDLMFTNGPKKLVASINATLSMNGSHLTKSRKFNLTNLYLNEEYIVGNSYSVPIAELFDGPIEDVEFLPREKNFPFVFEDLINENQLMSDYEDSSSFFKKTIDMKFFNNTIIVLTEDLVVFLINSFFVNILYNETATFLDPSCQIAHHNSDLSFIVYCQGNSLSTPGKIMLYSYSLNFNKINHFLDMNQSLLTCSDCLTLNHSEIKLPDQYGKIKKIVLKEEMMFCLSYLINNKNQENLTISNYTLIREGLAFVPITSFQASDFDLTYFKTKDFDILPYNKTQNSINFIISFILNPPIMIETDNFSNFLVIDIIFLKFPEEKKVVAILTRSCISRPSKDPLMITILNIKNDTNISAILSTQRCFLEINFDFNGNLRYLYTYEHYHRCENIDEKPIFFNNFLIAMCKRNDNGESNPQILPIFRNSANYTTITIYQKMNKRNSSYPVRMLTNYLADESFRQKFLIFNGSRPNGKKPIRLIVSDPFNFLTVHELYENVTFWLKKRELKISELDRTFRGKLVVSNKFDYSNITFVFPARNPTDYNKIIIYIVYGLLLGIGFLIMFAFLLFAIRKKEEGGVLIDRNLRSSMIKKNNSYTSGSLYDTNILTGSIQHRLSMKRINDKTKKKGKSQKKVKTKEKV